MAIDFFNGFNSVERFEDGLHLNPAGHELRAARALAVIGDPALVGLAR